ncbi:MAG: methyltransferase domain-containing protein [Nitrospinae bacterium]|nr:methyltransferase domain-containing protein [Nitrospinota bacterium]
MTTDVERPIEERILQVLQHLGIAQAHVAARVPGDWQGLATTHPEHIASLTLVCPQGMEPGILGPLASRLLVISGDQGRPAERTRRVVMNLPEATLHILRDYVSPTPYTDLAVDRTDEIKAAMTDFLARIDQRKGTRTVSLPEGNGEIAGISYRMQGAGSPLVLLPLSVAPSQWEPLLPPLSRQHCTITLSGPALGMVGSLEGRGHTSGYLSVVGRLLEAAHLTPGEVVLEVGCGTGVLDRWLARRTDGANRIVAVDINRFLLREAMALARQEGLEHRIEFREGNAEALPFPENSFDVAMSSTVIQRVEADRMLAEMVRVTKPGGRVAVIGHAHDMPRWVNLPLRAELKTQVEAPGWADESGHPRGCDDASLYQRVHQAGLTQVRMFPQLATFDDRSRLQQLQAIILPTLSPEEAKEWRAAVAQAEGEGTFFIATPFHCAVGTKA